MNALTEKNAFKKPLNKFARWDMALGCGLIGIFMPLVMILAGVVPAPNPGEISRKSLVFYAYLCVAGYYALSLGMTGSLAWRWIAQSRRRVITPSWLGGLSGVLVAIFGHIFFCFSSIVIIWLASQVIHITQGYFYFNHEAEILLTALSLFVWIGLYTLPCSMLLGILVAKRNNRQKSIYDLSVNERQEKKTKFIFRRLISAAIFILSMLIIDAYYIHQQQYKMAVRVIGDGPESSEWPSKRHWFDASEWLTQPHYTKVNDFYVVNTDFRPIDDLNDFLITDSIKEAIDKSINQLPQLTSLAKLDDQVFFRLMKDTLTYEYLYTQFDEETLKPEIDWFLVYFSYKDKDYEVKLLRKPYVYDRNKWSFLSYEGVYLKGKWHKETSLLSYRRIMDKKTNNKN